MKAKEYYTKYEPLIFVDEGFATEWSKAFDEMVLGLWDDFIALTKTRHCRTDVAVISCVEDVNQKWNAISRMFEKNNIITPMKENGFMILFSELIGDRITSDLKA